MKGGRVNLFFRPIEEWVGYGSANAGLAGCSDSAASQLHINL